MVEELGGFFSSRNHQIPVRWKPCSLLSVDRLIGSDRKLWPSCSECSDIAGGSRMTAMLCPAFSNKSYSKHKNLPLLIATYRQGSKQYQPHENWYRFQCQLPKPSSPGWNSIDSSCQRHPNEKTTRQGLCLGNRHFRGDDSVMVAVYWQEKWTSLTSFFSKYVSTKNVLTHRKQFVGMTGNYVPWPSWPRWKNNK